MTEKELAAIEGEHQRSQEGWDCGKDYEKYPCSVIALLAEVRRLRGQVRFHGGDPDITLTIKRTEGHGDYVAFYVVGEA